MKEIILTQGKIALVDDEDYELVNQYKWFAQKTTLTYYAGRNVYVENKRTTQQIQRFILNAPKGIEVDHQDHNGLNNQRYNIRLGTKNQNQYNQRKPSKSTSSKYKGVTWKIPNKKWEAYIKVNYKRIYLGLFDDEVEAALAYDQAAIIHFGEFAKLNYPLK